MEGPGAVGAAPGLDLLGDGEPVGPVLVEAAGAGAQLLAEAVAAEHGKFRVPSFKFRMRHLSGHVFRFLIRHSQFVTRNSAEELGGDVGRAADVVAGEPEAGDVAGDAHVLAGDAGMRPDVGGQLGVRDGVAEDQAVNGVGIPKQEAFAPGRAAIEGDAEHGHGAVDTVLGRATVMRPVGGLHPVKQAVVEEGEAVPAQVQIPRRIQPEEVALPTDIIEQDGGLGELGDGETELSPKAGALGDGGGIEIHAQPGLELPMSGGNGPQQRTVATGEVARTGTVLREERGAGGGQGIGREPLGQAFAAGVRGDGEQAFTALAQGGLVHT